MKILFNDILQDSDLPAALKTGALAECYKIGGGGLTVNLPRPGNIDCVGLGYTDATYFKFSFTVFEGWLLDGKNAFAVEADYEYIYDGKNALYTGYELVLDGGGAEPAEAGGGDVQDMVLYTDNGLYLLKQPVVTQRFTIQTDATYIGRVGAGRAVKLGTAPAKEPGYKNSVKPRVTLSGQAIPGAGGYSYRRVSLDTRYKIGHDAMDEIKAAYKTQTGPGLPFFLLFDDEIRRLPFSRLYAADTKNDSMVFESGVNRFLFSRKFEFEERF